MPDRTCSGHRKLARIDARTPTEGLGATVAGSVPVVAAVVVFAVLAGLAALPVPWWRGLIAVALAYLAASALLARCVQRLGGITGDVLGGCVEVAVTAALLALSF